MTGAARYPPSDEVFFVQNAGARAAGTGLEKSSIIQKISLAEAEAVRTSSDQKSEVTVTVVPSNPQVINPNGTALASRGLEQGLLTFSRRYKLQRPTSLRG